MLQIRGVLSCLSHGGLTIDPNLGGVICSSHNRLDMKRTAVVLSILFCLARGQAQETETYVLHQAVSNRVTIVYKRVIRFDNQKHLFHVQDYYEDGQVQMDAFYSSFDKKVKENYQCNYR